MHPDIKAFWEKSGAVESTFSAWSSQEYKDSYFMRKASIIRMIYSARSKEYWFHKSWDGFGKWYPEKEMLRIIKLKSFI